MIRQPILLQTRVVLGILSVLVIVGAYSWLSYRRHQANPRDKTLPHLSQFQEGWRMIVEGDARQDEQRSWRDSWLWIDARATYGRLLLGLGAGVLLSVLVGMAMGCYAALEAFFLPPLSFFARIPPTAMLAVYFVLFGIELEFFIAAIALGIFPILAQAIYQAAKNDVNDHAVYKAYTLGASQMEVIWNVITQQILPRVIENIRLQVGPAMVFLIAAEWAVANEGFGFRLRMQSRILNLNVVYIYLVILGISGFVFDGLLSTVRKKLCPWFGE